MSASKQVPAKPQHDPDQMASDALVTSIAAGISFVVSTIVLGLFGGVGILLANTVGVGSNVRMALVGLGFAAGVTLLVLTLRNFRVALERRGKPWFRGAVIGAAVSLAIIVIMYYFPGIAFPEYCPPGGMCEVTG
ncbi:MAG: hypothetical protein ACOYEV_05395 [Candidatus Nanopelagicales bacterium]